MKCDACESIEARSRRCSGDILCSVCRSKPEYRLISRSHVLKSTRLLESDLIGLAVGTAPNPVNVAFAPITMYYRKDILLLLLQYNYPIPDDIV
jgi:hypothetical protein